jgi:hypothetical protein
VEFGMADTIVKAAYAVKGFIPWIAMPTGPAGGTNFIIGGRDMEAGAVSVRLHGNGPQGAKPKTEVVAGILLDIRDRRA